MSAYKCPVCDYVYDEAKGAAREGFPPGTAWVMFPTTGAARTAGCAKKWTSKQ